MVGGFATGAVVSASTLIGALPLTPFTVATTWPIPGSVATK